MEDMISRQALCEYALNQKDKSITPNDIMRFPSAQSEPSQAARDIATILENEKDMRVIKKNAESESCADTISRQAAIDAVKKNTFRLTFAEEQNCEGHVAWSAEAVYSDVMEGALLDLPSAQPEPLTDKEQRIFLSAMEREEEVCKQVDAECRDCREPYEDSLVSVCHEITRKVKGALWT